MLTPRRCLYQVVRCSLRSCTWLGTFMFGVTIALLVRPWEMLQSVTKEADGTLTLTLEDGESLGGFDQVLVAAGREPILDKLGLDSAGVKTDRGHITVRASPRPQR